jgi:hypothetical protein
MGEATDKRRAIFTLTAGKSDFWSLTEIGKRKGSQVPTDQKAYANYLKANGAYALWVVTHHDAKDPEWAHHEEIWQTALDYVQNYGHIDRDRRPAPDDRPSVDKYFDNNDTTFVRSLPDRTIDVTKNVTEIAEGVAKMVGGYKEAKSGDFQGGGKDALEGVIGLASSFQDSVKDNRAWKEQQGADWNLTVDFATPAITGGGMDPVTLPYLTLPWGNQ